MAWEVLRKLSGGFNNMILFRKKFSNERRTGIFPVLLLLVGVFLFSAPIDALAASRVWGGGSVAPGTSGDYNWSTATHWTGDTVPQIGDTVTFNGTSTANCTIDNIGPANSHANQLGGFTVTSAYNGGVITQNVQVYSANMDLNLSNCTWTVSGASVEPEGFTISGGTFATTKAIWSWGSIACSGNGSINQTGEYMVMQGTATKTITNTGTGTITFRKFQEDSSTSTVSTAQTTIDCNVTVSGDHVVINISAIAGDGKLILATGRTLTITNGNFYNLGSFTAAASSTVKITGSIYSNDAKATVFSNSGTWEWNGTSDQEINIKDGLNHFNNFVVSGDHLLWALYYAAPLLIDGSYSQTGAGSTLKQDQAGLVISGTTSITNGTFLVYKSAKMVGAVTVGALGKIDIHPEFDNIDLEIGTSLANSGSVQVTFATTSHYARVKGTTGALRPITTTNIDFNQHTVHFDNVDVQVATSLSHANDGIIIDSACNFTDMTVSAGTLDDSSNAAFTVSGIWGISGSGVFTCGTGTVNLTGASKTITTSSTGADDFYHLTVTGSYTLADPLVVLGNLKVENGSLDVNNVGNYLLTVTGDIEFKTNGTFYARSGEVIWNGSTPQHIQPHATQSNFYKFTLTSSPDYQPLYIETNTLTVNNDFTVNSGTAIVSSGLSVGHDIIMPGPGGRFEAKNTVNVTRNITLSGDALFWGVGDGLPTVVTFGGIFSCAGTSKLQAEYCDLSGGGAKYFKLVGSSVGSKNQFTGSNSQFLQTISPTICAVYFDNIYLNLSDTLTRTAGQEITLAGDCQFNAITLNGSADTLFDTGAHTATVGGTFLNTFGVVTIGSGGAINAGANAFTSDTANSAVGTSGALTCGDLTLTNGTFTNTATNTISASGNVVISSFGATTTNNTLTMTGDGKYINSTVNLGNFVNNGGTDVAGNRNYISTDNLTLDGTFTNNSGKCFTTLDGATSRDLTTGNAGVNGTISIAGLFYANNSTITIKDATTGNFDVNGQSNFDSGTSTVDLQGTGSIIGHENWITFYSLTCGHPGKITTLKPSTTAPFEGMDIYGALTVGTGTLIQDTTLPAGATRKIESYGATVANTGTIDVAELEATKGSTAGISGISGGNYATTTIQLNDGSTLNLGGSISASGNWRVGYITDDRKNVLNLNNHDIISSGYFDVGSSDTAKLKCVGQVICGTGSITTGSDMHIYSRKTSSGDASSINLGSGTHTIPGEFGLLYAKLDYGTAAPDASATLSSGTTSVGGRFQVNSGATLTAASGTLRLYGATTPQTFTPGSGSYAGLKIEKTNSTDQVDVGTDALTLTGSLTLTKGILNLQTDTNLGTSVGIAAGSTLTGTTGGKTIKFAAGSTTTIANDATAKFIFTGTTGHLINLYSSSSPTQWKINRGTAGATTGMDYVNVKDSDASGGSVMTAGTHSTDAGHNINWLFNNGHQISGTVYKDQGSTIIDKNCTITMYLYYSSTGSTLTESTTATAGVGTYSFTGLNLTAGDVATIYIDSSPDGYQGSVTYRASAAGAADVNIYKDHVIIRSDSGAITNTNMGNANNGATDIKYAVVGGNLTVSDNFEAYIWAGGEFKPGGTVTVDDINVQGTFTMEANAVTVSGTWITGAAGAFTSSGTVTFDSAAAKQITSHNQSFNAVTFNNPAGTGSWTLQDTANFGGATNVTKGEFITGANTLTVGGTLTIDGGTATFTTATLIDCTGAVALSAGTLTAPNNTMNVAGNLTISGTGAFTCGTGTVKFNGAVAQSVTSNSKTYNAITVTNAAAAGVTFEDAFTAASFTATTANTHLYFKEGLVYTITGAAGLFNLNGHAAGTEVLVDSKNSANQFTLDFTGGAQTVNYVNLDQCIAGTNPGTANNSIDGGHNTNWTFGAATRYWVNAGAGDWVTNANWSSSSGGAPGANYPKAGDTAVFDNGGAGNCTLNAAVNIAQLQMKGAPTAYAGTISCGANDFTTTGAMTITSGIFTVGANTTTVGGTLTIDGGTATFTNATLVDCNGAVAFSGGTLTAPNTTMNVAGDWTQTAAAGSFTCGTGTVKFDGAAQQIIRSNGATYNKITVTNASGVGNGVVFREAFTAASFEDVTPTTFLYFKQGLTYTISGAAGSFNLNGQAVGTRITVDSEDSATQFTLGFTGGAQTVNYVDLDQCIAGTNAGKAYNSVDGTHNTNWTFTNLVITAPTAGSNVNQRPTIIGTGSPGDIVTIKGTVGGVAFQAVATATIDANGNYRVRPTYIDANGISQTDYTATLDLGANNIRADVGVNPGPVVAVTVKAAPTTNETPTITSPADGGRINGSTPTISGKGLAGQNVTLTANDANGNLLLTQVVKAAALVTVDAGGNWTINSADYTTALVKGVNYLSVTVGGVASNITTVTFTDPFGVVFDSVTNSPIAGATVTIFTAAGVQCRPGFEIAAGDLNPQTTGADGAYNFLTINGNFYFTVSAAGYNFPSTVTNLPAGRVIVNGSRGEVFTVAGVVIQMDFPMDTTNMLLRIKKTANKKEAVIGDIVTYTVTIKNLGSTDVSGVYLADQIPAGFKYINGKAILDNVPLNPSGTRPIIFNIGTVTAGQTRTLKYQLVVGSGVTQGNYENTAWAQYSNGTIISNKDRQTVKITLDPLFDLGTIIGKVFWDRNETGYQEAPKKTGEDPEAESGIAGVQIVMEDGTVVTTDDDGKYHFQAIIPGRHLIRLNERTLPDGAYLTTDKIVVVDTTNGLLSKVNFGVNSKDKGRKELKKENLPVKILQKEEKVRPLLNAAPYPPVIISYAGYGSEVQSLPNAYEFRIFTNYSLFIKNWKLEILDRETKALVKGFSGTYLTLNEPVYWDGKDKDGKWLDPDRNYVYVLSVMDRTGRADTTKPQKLTVAKYKAQALESSDSEKKKLKSEWRKEKGLANNLDIQNIKLSNKVVVVESKGGFEAKQDVTVPEVDDTSRINIMVDETAVPVAAPTGEANEFVQEVVVPEGEHKVTVESVDTGGKKETQTQYVKDKENSLLFVAMGDGKGGYTFQKGNIEAAGPDDKYRKGFWSEGKLSYYLKGKVLGKYLITSSLDTDRQKKELFRNLDPNKYYPVYGDASKVNYDATNTQGMLYLLVEWDKSSALWGDYNVDFKDAEFATFKRTLYGANVNYEAVSTTQFGEPNTKLAVFKATAKQQAAHNEFVGTGGSLFYLKNKNITEGSEKVAIEVRDKVTGLVLATLAQNEGFDYQIDYDNGRLMLWEPVSQIAESNSIVSSALLNGNPVYVTVDYEFETLDKYNEGVYGVRAEQSITDYVRLGGTYIKEGQQDENYSLAGVDTTVHFGAKTQVTGEFAQSRSQELGRFISTDGGLTFTPLITDEAALGRAYGVKGESRLFDKLGVSGYYKRIDKDFSSISTASQQGKEMMGAAVTYDITPKTRITARQDTQELLADGNLQTQLQVGAKKTTTTTAQITHTMDKLKLTGEYRHQNTGEKIEKFESETNENGDILAARADYKLTNKTNVFAEQQGSIKGSPNNQTTAGVETKLNDYVSLRGKETVGNRGNATSVGAFTDITDKFKLSGDYTSAAYNTGDRENTAAATASAKVDETSEIYDTYATSNSAFEGKRDSHVLGAKKTTNNGLELSMEQQEANSAIEVSDTNIYGVSGKVNDKLALTAKYEKGVVQDFDGTRYNRNAPSLGLSYADKDKIKASLKGEARFDNGTEDKRQYLIYAAFEDKLTRDLTLFAKANVSSSDNTSLSSNLASYKEFTLGTAYRPVNFDRLNLLARYNYLQNDAPSQQADIHDIEGTKAHVLSGEAAFDLTEHWQIVQKLALRIQEEKVTGFEFTRTQTWLVVDRLNYNINRDWLVGAEYRRLAQSQAKDAKQGALVELARNIGEYVQASVGYNFTDFSDDLTYLGYTAQGPFARLTGKFFDRTPEEIEQLRQRQEEENIKRWVQELLDNELSRPGSKIAQELRRYNRIAEAAQQQGELETAKKYYAKVIEIGNKMRQEAEDYVRYRIELEKTLARNDELARAYYKDGRLQEAKEEWEKIIEAGSANIYPANW